VYNNNRVEVYYKINPSGFRHLAKCSRRWKSSCSSNACLMGKSQSNPCLTTASCYHDASLYWHWQWQWQLLLADLPACPTPVLVFQGLLLQLQLHFAVSIPMSISCLRTPGHILRSKNITLLTPKRYWVLVLPF
jgi:hypothetical protein